MKGHTPGPWHVCADPPLLVMGDCELGGQIWGGPRVAFTERQNVGVETEQANARLIAQAPAMYSLLEEAYSYLVTIQPQLAGEIDGVLSSVAEGSAA